MTQLCKCCSHAESKKINRLLVEGKTLRGIADEFGMSHVSVKRHKEACIPKKVKAAQEKRGEIEGDFVLRRLDNLCEEAELLLAQAKADDDYGQALRNLTEMRKQLELFAKIKGDMPTTVNVNINAEIVEFRTVIMDKLKKHPEAKKEIIETLKVLL